MLMVNSNILTGPPRRPWGLKWRSSIAFTTVVVSVGITTDLIVYSVITPVIPFQLERLHYSSVSALTGWLFFAFSVGTVISTIPIATYSENTSSRRAPYIIGLISLLAAQVLLMEAPNYATMVVARLLQGVSSAVVWIIGLALICDVTPQQNVGKQIGLAATGLSVGLIAGAPVGGSLYARYGFRAPFIYAEICILVDLILRLLVIEKAVAIKWGFDPATGQDVTIVADSSLNSSSDTAKPSQSTLTPVQPLSEQTMVSLDPQEIQYTLQVDPCTPTGNDPTASNLSAIRNLLSIFTVTLRLMQSSRAGVVLILSLIFGILMSMFDTILSLRLQEVWGYTSEQVGRVYVASFVPGLVSSPLAGLLVDRISPGYIASICLIFTAPCYIVLVLRKHVALFIVALVLSSFFTVAMNTLGIAELAAVSRASEGVGYAHVYAAFNMAFGIGTILGPVLGGQIYGHVQDGWAVICYMTTALLVICIIAVFCYVGEDPLRSQMLRRWKRSQDQRPGPTEKDNIGAEDAASCRVASRGQGAEVGTHV